MVKTLKKREISWLVFVWYLHDASHTHKNFPFYQLRNSDSNNDLKLKYNRLGVVGYEEIMYWIKELDSSEEVAGG